MPVLITEDETFLLVLMAVVNRPTPSAVREDFYNSINLLYARSVY